MLSLMIFVALVALACLIALARTPIQRGMNRLAGSVGGFNVKDANLKDTCTLPAGALTTYSAGIDLRGSAPYSGSSRPDFVANCEMLLTAPALTTVQLPDAQTVTYSIQSADDSAFGTNLTTVAASCLVQTGAGGAGAASATVRYRPATNAQRYFRLKAVKVGAADASGASATLDLVF